MRRMPIVPVLVIASTVAFSASAAAQPLPGPAASPAGGALPGAAPTGGVAGYYRTPTIQGRTIVFAAEGDLWKVSVAGGVARRLTTHPAEETSPVLSPDGGTLAFTAHYEGPAEVYTMPLSGGVPVRRTFEADTSIATTWTPGGRLVYTTQYYATLPVPQLVALDPDANTRERIPLSTASEAAYDDTGELLFFVRPAFHNNVTKRYVGGTARDVWKFEAGSPEAVELTGDYAGESHSPMWWRGRVYFVTDRDGTMNLWSMTADGGDLRQHTEHAGWDVRDPDLSAGRIVYQLGADLWTYDISADVAAVVPITLASDFDQLREKWETDPVRYLTSAHLHPQGRSVVLTARGRVFVAPAGSGRLVQATRDEGVRYRDVVFMPDGSLVGLSDATGEFEFVRIPANGVGSPEPLSDNGAVLRFQGTPSPDGRWIAFTDMNRDLSLLDTDTGETRIISENREGIGAMSWSPDSRWLAYTMTAMNSFRQIKLYNVDAETTTALTSDRTNSTSPAWGPDGEFLYFASDRNLRSVVGSPWGPRQPEPYFDRPIKLYEVALRRGLRSPFRLADELAGGDGGPQPSAAAPAGDDDAQGSEGQGEDEAVAPEAIEIDLDGIERRLREVPVEPGTYTGLQANEHALFYLSRTGAGAGSSTNLMALPFDGEDPRPIAVVERARQTQLSLDGEKLLVRRANDFFILDARPQAAGSRLDDGKVDLGSWAFRMDVREDWRQMLVDAWRMERDYFYDPGMHGVDWEGALAKYMPLVDRVTTRAELSDLIGRFVGELSALHTSVRGGDLRSGDDDVSVASLGARLLRDPAAGGYRIDYIYQSDPDYPDERSPLADPYLDIDEGDVIEAVNGVSTLDVPDIGALLRNQGGRQVLLSVRRGNTRTSRDVIAVPITNERDLRYGDWEYTRRLIVEERGGGQIGYVHLRAMGSNDLTAWYRQFYPVFNRQGLVLDVRRNNGGNIDSIILEKLMRRAWMYWRQRVGQPTWNMQYAFRGHMVVLVDQNTASDGEAVAEGFRRLGLGPVIGMRTWGGEIWLGSSNRLSDGGLARAPSMGVYGPEGEWLIEQIGVIPDIVVDNLPHATFNGGDAQLDAAIAYLLDKIENEPLPVPAPPAYPSKAFEYRQD